MRQNIVEHLTGALHLPESEVPALYEVFLRTLDDCLGQLRGADGPSPDYMAIRRATHTLMGFSRNVGAADLGDAAVALNASAHAADASACSIGIRDIESICASYRDD